jgi:hypothetical protein
MASDWCYFWAILLFQNNFMVFTPNPYGGRGGGFVPPWGFFNSREQISVLGDPGTSWLFNPANYGNFKPFFRSTLRSVQFLWPFLSRRILILPKEKFLRKKILWDSRFRNGCIINNFLWKRLGKVAMSQNSIVFGHGQEK